MIEVIAICGLVFGVIGLCIGIFALIEVKALMKSTHSVQYVDPFKDEPQKYEEAGFEVLDKKTREKLEDESDLFDDETNFQEMQ